MHQETPQVQLRLTGNRADITQLIAALDTANLNDWHIEIETTKTRPGGNIQTYATATKEEKP